MPLIQILAGRAINLLGKNNGTITRPEIHLSNVETSWANIEIEKLNLIKPIALFPFSVASNRNLPFEILKKWIKKMEPGEAETSPETDFT